jgi:enoyl-CoA hydratase/carnithine racemase
VNSHDAAGPVRLEPHPADSRLGMLRVDRPPVNAFDQRMWDQFDRVAASLHGPTLYRAVVITGGPRHFAAGADVQELTQLTAEQFGARNRVLQRADDAEVLDVAVAEGLGYARGPLSLRYAKQAVNATADLPVEAGLELEADLIARCFASEDGQRGLGSFVDDGPGQAKFLGR